MKPRPHRAVPRAIVPHAIVPHAITLAPHGDTPHAAAVHPEIVPPGTDRHAEVAPHAVTATGLHRDKPWKEAAIHSLLVPAIGAENSAAVF